MVSLHLSRKASLVFLHIPKTGGSSLTKSLRSYFPEASCFTDNGNISVGLLERHAPELAHLCLFYGHPEHHILRLCGAARTATVLRRPRDHAISHYLHILRDARLPLHQAALEHDFPQFLRLHWPCLVFQAISLDVAQSSSSICGREDFIQRLPSIHALLNRIEFVGCLEHLDDVLQEIAAAFGWPLPGQVLRLNAASDYGVESARIIYMRTQYEALRSDPTVAELIAAEEAIYSQACKIADRRRAAKILAAGRDQAVFEPFWRRGVPSDDRE